MNGTRYVCPTCSSSIVVYVTVKGAWCSKDSRGIPHATATMVRETRKATAQ